MYDWLTDKWWTQLLDYFLLFYGSYFKHILLKFGNSAWRHNLFNMTSYSDLSESFLLNNTLESQVVSSRFTLKPFKDPISHFVCIFACIIKPWFIERFTCNIFQNISDQRLAIIIMSCWCRRLLHRCWHWSRFAFNSFNLRILSNDGGPRLCKMKGKVVTSWKIGTNSSG